MGDFKCRLGNFSQAVTVEHNANTKPGVVQLVTRDEVGDRKDVVYLDLDWSAAITLETALREARQRIPKDKRHGS